MRDTSLWASYLKWATDKWQQKHVELCPVCKGQPPERCVEHDRMWKTWGMFDLKRCGAKNSEPQIGRCMADTGHTGNHYTRDFNWPNRGEK